MPLGAADKTRIYKYRAFNLGTQAGGALTYNEVLELIQQQMDDINAIDTEQGTTFATEIQADLDQLDTMDAALTAAQGSENANLIQADVLQWLPGGKVSGYKSEMARLTKRIARVLAQSYEDIDNASILGRG